MRHSLVATLFAAAALTACGPTVSYQRAPDIRIEPGSGWAWSPPDQDGLTREQGANLPPDSTARLISATIERALVAKGFPRTSPESARFIVHYHVGRRQVSDTLPPRDDPTNPGGAVRMPGSWGGYGSPEELAERTVTWQEGMLVVDALTPDGRIVVWRGTIAGEIPAKAETRPEQAIGEAVSRLLRGFP